MSRKYLVLAALFLLVLAGCSGSNATAGGDETPDETPAEVTEAPSGLPDSNPIDGLRALAEANSTVSVAYSTQTTLDVDGTEFDIDAQIQNGLPSFIETIGTDGVVHTRMDVGSGAAIWAEGFFGEDVATAFIGVGLDLWETGDELIIDTSSFQSIVPIATSINIGSSLGPFEPDVWSLDRPELKAGLISQTTAFGPFIDINVLQAEGGTLTFASETLPDLLESFETTEIEGPFLTATAPYGDLVDAMGLDLTRTLLSALFPIQEDVPTPDQQIQAMDFITATARTAIAEVTAGPSPADPNLVELTITVDLSNMYEQLADDGPIELGNTADVVASTFLEYQHRIQAWPSNALPQPIPTDVNDRSAEFAGVQ